MVLNPLQCTTQMLTPPEQAAYMQLDIKVTEAIHVYWAAHDFLAEECPYLREEKSLR
jgi:hypothetical protein